MVKNVKNKAFFGLHEESASEYTGSNSQEIRHADIMKVLSGCIMGEDSKILWSWIARFIIPTKHSRKIKYIVRVKIVTTAIKSNQ